MCNGKYEFFHVNMEYALENPDLYIIPKCLEVYKILWNKGIDTIQCCNNDKGIIKDNLINKILGHNIDNYKEFDKLIKNNISFYHKRYKDTTKYGDKNGLIWC